MKLVVTRRSGLPIKLDQSEIDSLDKLPIIEAIEYERALRKSKRPTSVEYPVSNLSQAAEILDQVSRYNNISVKMNGADTMLVEILDQIGRE